MRKVSWLILVAAIVLFFLLTTRRHTAPVTNATTTTTSSGNAKTVSSVGGAQFRDIAREAGIAYCWITDGSEGLDPLTMSGYGCAFLDYDNDGNLDILLIGPKLALYKGDGHGHFKDVTHETGLDKLHGQFLGCAVGDYDNDGYEDIYISAYRGGVLLHNEHGKFFKDVTKEMGIKPQPFGISCAFGDIDGDGRLDLYIGNYVVFEQTPGAERSPDPGRHDPEYGVLLHNEGNRFRDVSAAWNADSKFLSGKVMGVLIADLDGSGRQSIAIANDQEPGDLLLNQGGKFKNIGKPSGFALQPNGTTHGGMGLDCGDYANDGRLDLFVNTYRDEVKSLYRNTGHALFTDVSTKLGIAETLRTYVSWGVKFLDYDNDGFLDFIITNGHVNNRPPDLRPDTETFRQPTLLFHNLGGKAFEDVSQTSGDALTTPILGRGLAIGDFDNDGKMDVLIVDADGRPLLLHNETPNVGHWLLCKLIGTKSNRDGIGALLTFETPDGRKMLRRCATDGSYLSASDKRVHCGLGKATSATITVKWPSGHIDVYRHVRADRVVTLKEGGSAAL